MLRYWTAGESHGPALVALVDGFPAGMAVDSSLIDAANPNVLFGTCAIGFRAPIRQITQMDVELLSVARIGNGGVGRQVIRLH